ncbi:MAG TPA: cation diffusion facilitator family transporter, partial [Chloroflexota bacterium]
FALTAVILLVELAGAILSHSLALLSDAGHVFTDIFALGLAWFATFQAERPADATRTYGYHRTGILAALINAAALILIVLAIAYEALRRFQHPQEVTPWLMFVAASVGIVVNLYIGFSLRQEGNENINVRAARLHVFGDVGASAGVVVGGLVILLTHWYQADPLISLFIAALIAKGAWDIVRETFDILMESTPRNLNVAQLVRDMVREPGIQDVHDLHVWSLAGGMCCLTAHIQVEDGLLSERDRLLGRLDSMLRERYRIGHTTIQLECAGCESNHLYCEMKQMEAHSHRHDHKVRLGTGG